MKKVLVLAVVLALAALACWKFLLSPAGSGPLVLYGNMDQRQVELAFADAERVAEVLVQEGALVEPGQVLARLDTRRLKDRIAAAEAQTAAARALRDRMVNGTRPEEKEKARAAVDSARADLDYAEKQYRRVQNIWKESGGAGVRKSAVDEASSRLDSARARLRLEENSLRLALIGNRQEDIENAEATLRERESSLAQLRTQLADAELTSPARSVVNRRLLEPGDMASPQRAVFSLAVLSPKWVRAYIPETELARIRQGLGAEVRADSLKEAMPGTVGFISPVAEFTPKAVETPELRTSLVYEVRVYVDDPGDLLRLGMPVTVTFPTDATDASR